MIDYWKLTKDFKQGDVVQKIDVTGGDLSPYVGAVTAVHPGLGVLDVQWPYGNERVFPDDVVLVSPDFIRYLPPQFDSSYSSYDIEKARRQASAAGLWGFVGAPPDLFVKLARYWSQGATEVVAYDDLYRTYEPNIDDEALRNEVSKFYQFASNAGDMRIKAHVSKSGAYWVAQDRRYRATSDDLKCGKPSCPKCTTKMRRALYRMEKGARHKLFACPRCLHLIDPASILAPSGEPHTWF